MTLEESAKRILSLLNLHKRAVRDIRYSRCFRAPVTLPDGTQTEVGSPDDLAPLGVGTVIEMFGHEWVIVMGGLAYPGEQDSVISFDTCFDEMLRYYAGYTAHPEWAPRIISRPDTEHKTGN